MDKSFSIDFLLADPAALVTALRNAGKAAETLDAGVKDVGKSADDAAKSVAKLEKAAKVGESVPRYQYAKPIGPEPAKKKDLYQYAKPIGPEPLQYASGAHQRRDSLRQQVESMDAQGVPANDSRRKDVEHGLSQVNKQIDKWGEKPAGGLRGALGRMSALTRSVNVESVVNGGIGGLADQALGGLGMMGPEGKGAELAIRASIEVSKALFELARNASEVSMRLSAAQMTIGSSSGETAGIVGISNAGGFDAAGAAASLHKSITTDSVAQMTAAKFGAHSVGGPFGTQDYAPAFLKVLQGLRAENRQSQVIDARRMGMQASDPLLSVSDKTFNKITGSDAGTTDGINSPEQIQKAAEFKASMGRFQTAKDNLTDAMGGPLMADLSDFFNDSADAINKFAKWSADHKNAVQAMSKGFRDAILNVLPGGASVAAAMDIHDQMKGGGSPSPTPDTTDQALSRQAGALDRNTDSNLALTIATNKLAASGQDFGGGNRGVGGMPNAFRGPGTPQGALRAAMQSGDIGFDTL